MLDIHDAGHRQICDNVQCLRAPKWFPEYQHNSDALVHVKLFEPPCLTLAQAWSELNLRYHRWRCCDNDSVCLDDVGPRWTSSA